MSDDEIETAADLVRRFPARTAALPDIAPLCPVQRAVDAGDMLTDEERAMVRKSAERKFWE